jgi:hypothetical protein
MRAKTCIFALLLDYPCRRWPHPEAGRSRAPEPRTPILPTKYVIAVGKNLGAHLRVDETVDDILKNPAFGRLRSSHAAVG